MDHEKDLTVRTNVPPVSRRGFLRGASALASAAAAVTTSQAQSGQVIAYVGAYTDKGKGIHMYFLNPSDGTLTPWKILTGLPSPSSIYFHPSKKYLYAVNEISNFNGTRNGSVTAIAVDVTGDLKIINVVDSQGSGPAHLSVDPTGKWVFAANYGGGSVAVLPINADGSLGAATHVQKLSGPLGPQPAWDAPPGSFANSGHDATHAHMAQTDPSGNFLLVADLGTDRIFIFKFDKDKGTLSPADQPFLQASPGAGPRHFDFHPNGRWLYAITEEASTMLYMSWSASSGAIEIKQSTSSLPEGYGGTNYPSEIHVSEDGQFLYGANRLHDSIAVFSINPDGWMIKLDDVWTQGSYPRHFAVDPTGNFLYVCHSRSDNVTSFRVDRNTGMLKFTGQFVPIGNPSKIAFLQL